MTTAEHLQQELKKLGNTSRADILQRFFQTKKGEYGEGDRFLGLQVPQQRLIAKRFKERITLADIEMLLHTNIHEYRLTALFLLIHKYDKADNNKKKKYIDFYIKNLDWVNNWDLVDSSAYKLLGDWLIDNKSQRNKLLLPLAKSNHLWRERVSVIATLALIKQDEYDEILMLSKHFLYHPHDLMHKAVGWMLREMGKRDTTPLFKFLDEYTTSMPRTMLRYAIEKLDEPIRQTYLKKK